ncbi:hypothetical protein EV1_027062 [Malus domestica]
MVELTKSPNKFGFLLTTVIGVAETAGATNVQLFPKISPTMEVGGVGQSGSGALGRSLLVGPGGGSTGGGLLPGGSGLGGGGGGGERRGLVLLNDQLLDYGQGLWVGKILHDQGLGSGSE